MKNQVEISTSQLVEDKKTIEELTNKLNNSTQTISRLQQELKVKDNAIDKQIEENNKAIIEAKYAKNDIQSILDQNFALLINSYKVQIFYNNQKPEQKKAALEIENALKKAGLRTIEVKIQQDTASSDQIRYFPENETEIANVLQKILIESYSQRSFKLQPVYTPSPRSVSIFLKS